MKNNRNLNDLRYIAEYIRATKNEIAVDDKAFIYAGRKADDVGYIPRPSMWLERVGYRFKWTRLLSLVARTVFKATAGAPFHAWEALRIARALPYSAKDDAWAKKLAAQKIIGLAFSKRAMEIVRRPAIEDAPAVWILPPWVEPSSTADGTLTLSLLQLSSRADIIRAFKLSLIATLRFGSSRGDRRWMLQCYTAMQWFVSRLALRTLDADFIIAEHFDRWAVLADATIRDARRNRSKTFEPKLVLVQHGTVGSLGEVDDGEIKLNYQLTSVTKIYAYSHSAASIFRASLVTPNCAKYLRTVLFNPSINLTVRSDRNRPSILFVGHPICASAQVAIYRQIKNLDIEIYYKPHPIAGTPDVCRDLNWIVIEDKLFFPDVNLLVSYRSTLVDEYSSVGIPSVIHSLKEDKLDVEAVARRVREILRLPP